MARWDRHGEASVPDWFWAAVETPSEQRDVEVDECDVVYRVWEGAGTATRSPAEGSLHARGVPSRSPAGGSLLLIHGMNAHSRWWDFIAPQLLDEYRVVAMDLTGMGDSDYRYAYDAETYAQEIVAVCDAAGLDEDVLVVGHSFGGMVAAKACNLFPKRFGALLLVDSGLRHPDEPEPDRPLMGGGRAKAYPDRQIAESRFRLFPPQPCDNDYLLAYIAKHSLMRVDSGWAWKFDEELPLTLTGGERYPDDYRQLPLPVGIIYGALSESFTKRTLEHMLELLPGQVPTREIADARHHVFLDQPQAFVEALRDVAGELRRRMK